MLIDSDEATNSVGLGFFFFFSESVLTSVASIYFCLSLLYSRINVKL